MLETEALRSCVELARTELSGAKGVAVLSSNYPRDLVGYGRNPPKADWPGAARLAVQFVLNYEEGGENCILHGDATSESFLSEIVAAQPLPGVRHMSMESLYEYGSRVGVWRLLRLFETKGIPLTIFAVAMAAERHPAVIKAMVEAGHEIASHGFRWINYQYVDEAEERAHLHQAMVILEQVSGQRPSRLVYRPDQSEHPPPGRRIWRLPLRCRCL